MCAAVMQNCTLYTPASSPDEAVYSVGYTLIFDDVSSKWFKLLLGNEKQNSLVTC